MALETEVKLLGTPTSPFADRVRMALSVKSVDYEFVIEDLKNKSEFLLESNPAYKRIPVLIHAGKPVCESLIINEFIDEAWTHGPTLMPAHPYDRATARFLAYIIDNKFYPLLRELAIFVDGEEETMAAKKQIDEVTMILEEAFVKCSKGKAFFGGEDIGFVDIAFGCLLSWINAVEELNNIKLLDETTMPGLVEWANNFRAHDAVKHVPAEPAAFLESGKRMREKAKGLKASKN